MNLRDPQSLPKILIGGALILAPLAYLASTLVAPPLRATETAQLAIIAEHPGRSYLFALLTIIGSILLVPAIIGVTQLLRDRSPWLGYFGGGLAGLGVLIAIGDSFGLLTTWQMAAPTADREQMVTLMHRLDTTPGIAFLFTIGGLTIITGTALLGLGLLRSHATPRWAAVALPTGAIINIAGFAAHSLPILDLSAILLLAAFAPIAATTLELHSACQGVTFEHPVQTPVTPGK